MSLPDTAVGDKAIDALSGLKLKSIDLRATKITDNGLMQLVRMPTLNSINVMQTSVSKDALTRAKLALPKASING